MNPNDGSMMFNAMPSRKLTWQWKTTIFNRRYIFIHGGFPIANVITSMFVTLPTQQLTKLLENVTISSPIFFASGRFPGPTTGPGPGSFDDSVSAEDFEVLLRWANPKTSSFVAPEGWLRVTELPPTKGT